MNVEIIKALLGLKAFIGENLNNDKGQFAVDMVIGIVVSIVLAAVIVMPSMETLVEDMVGALSGWWNTIESTVFKTSMPVT
ncbi:hypothetical protein [Acidaminobacter sp.]|uniref:hypothetical protein n=1 Tax=Acidaminobacter sp. TaxID=1872102 RepID=UPI00137E451D|nr:hypothetical protein [Acidaminobacter sp.]MDK9710233.1 hypothetical protein [Acidaminobacter sp.]MZQ98681.1 hypothetical protein [Acidaminobacter sp.]